MSTLAAQLCLGNRVVPYLNGLYFFSSSNHREAVAIASWVQAELHLLCATEEERQESSRQRRLRTNLLLCHHEFVLLYFQYFFPIRLHEYWPPQIKHQGHCQSITMLGIQLKKDAMQHSKWSLRRWCSASAPPSAEEDGEKIVLTWQNWTLSSGRINRCLT